MSWHSLFGLDLNQTFRPFSPSGLYDSNPYGLEEHGLIDYDNMDSGEFLYCKWGNSIGTSQDYTDPLGYGYVSINYLTLGPFSYQNKDLFISTSKDYLQRLALPIEGPSATDATWVAPAGVDNGYLSYLPRLGTAPEFVFRKLHFGLRHAIRDEVSGLWLEDAPKKNLIVLVHGWNPDSKYDMYDGNFARIKDAAIAEIRNNGAEDDWGVVQYHWERDADTGTILTGNVIGNTFAFTNATEAAEIANLHGRHVAELLLAASPEVEKVHFIAHSAGSWVARSGAYGLLLGREKVSTQVTLLDPFIPGANGLIGSLLQPTTMSSLNTVGQLYGDRIYRLENYFAEDETDIGTANATSQIFTWSDPSWNHQQRVDWGGVLIGDSPRVYGDHDSPVEFYADSIIGSIKQPSYEDWSDLGWINSMFMNEPLFTGPSLEFQSDTLNEGDPLTLAVSGTTRTGPFQGTESWQWYQGGVLIEGATSDTLMIPSIALEDQGKYSVEVTYNDLSNMSGSAFIEIVGAGPYIINQPQSITVAQGSIATFSVTAGGGATISYQWMEDGGDILGANAAFYQLFGVAEGDTGKQYSVRVTDATGSEISLAATLTVTAVAAGDPYEPNDSSPQATPLSFDTPLQAYIQSGADVDWYSVNVTQAGILQLDLDVPDGLDFDLEVYDTSGTYIMGSYGNTSEDESVSLNLTTIGTYVLRVYGYPVGAGSWDASNPYTLTTSFTNGEIFIPPGLGEPHDRTVPRSAHVDFWVIANSTADSSLSYQWYRNGSPISGAVHSTFRIQRVNQSDNGHTFHVVVSNTFGAIQTSTAVLTVNDPLSNVWIGGSGDWGVSTNWSLARLPNQDDVVRINSGTVSISTDAEADYIICDGTLELITGGSIEGRVSIHGNFKWYGGAIGRYRESCTLTVTSTGQADIIGLEAKTMSYGSIQNSGLLNSEDGVTYSGYGSVNNDPEGSIVIQGSGSGRFVNYGQITKNGAGEFTILSGSGFTNKGSIIVNEGILNLGTVTTNSGNIEILDGGSLVAASGNHSGSFITYSGGSLSLSGGTYTGIFSTSEGADFLFNGGTVSEGTTFAGSGTVDIRGQISGELHGEKFRLSSGELRANPSCILVGKLEWMGGTIRGNWQIPHGTTINITGNNPKYFYAGTLFENGGLVQWTGSGQILNKDTSLSAQSATIHNLASGVFDIRTDAGWDTNSPTSNSKFTMYFTNYGNMRRSGSGDLANLKSFRLTNLGLVSVIANSLQLDTVESFGSFEVSENALLYLNGSNSLNAGSQFSGDGLVYPTGSVSGTLNGNNFIVSEGQLRANPECSLVGTLQWKGGTLRGNWYVAQGSTVYISGNDPKYFYSSTFFENAGTVEWTGLGQILNEDTSLSAQSATIHNLATGLFDIQTDAGWDTSRPTSNSKFTMYFTNYGNMRRSGPGDLANFKLFRLTNVGSIDIFDGGLQVENLTNEGTASVESSTLSFRPNSNEVRGDIELNEGTVIFLASPRLIDGCSIYGNGNLLGNIDNISGTISPGSPLGTITIEGNYSQGPNGALSVELAGLSPDTEHDQLIVTGNVSLNGIANVQLLAPYSPAATEAFEIISSGGTISGEFSEVAGAYVSRSLVFSPQYTANAASLVTRASSPFEQWAWDDFGESAQDSTVSGRFKDPEGDGIINLLEYAFSLNPLIHDSGDMISEGMSTVADEDYFSITFTRPKGVTGITYIPWVSSGLQGSWDTGTSFTEISETIDNGDTETITIRDKTPVRDADSRFMKIEVIEE
jgi:hypothetical protein